MEAVFHEQQEGSLCAQHCLNSLLQGQFYSAVDLAELAQELDGLEMAQMAELGDSAEYRQFLQQPSINMDDSGFFSVQVISRALSVWGLELVAYSSADPLAVRVRQSPLAATAYICNYREHWFTIRRLGSQWFNLNSLLEYPELVSNTYLGEFLAQLQQEGYSIFIVKGQLPECDADLVLQAVPAEQQRRPRLLADVQSSGAGKGRRGSKPSIDASPANQPHSTASSSARDEEADIEAAMMLSLAENVPGPSGGPATIDDNELQAALAMSRGGEDSDMEMALALSQSSQPTTVPQESEEDELQKAISLSLSSSAGAQQPATPATRSQPSSSAGGWGARLEAQQAEDEEKYIRQQHKEEEDEEEQLRKALAMSLQGDPKRETEIPITNVGGVLKHKKLTSPTGRRMDVEEKQAAEISSKSASVPVRSEPKMKADQPVSSGQVKTNVGSRTPSETKPKSTAAAAAATAATPSPAKPSQSPSKPSPVPAGSTPSPGGTAPPAQIPESGGHTLGGGPRRPAGDADPAEIRRRRLAFLEKMQQNQANTQK